MALFVGQAVFYVPDQGHAHDKDGFGEWCFHFVWLEGPQANQRVDMSRCGYLVRDPAGKLHAANGGGLTLAPSEPKYHWKAIIQNVKPDGSALLAIQHPNGCGTLFYTCAHDAAKRPHTFYCEGE